MNLNINAIVTNLSGDPIHNEETNCPVTLGWIAIQCLMSPKDATALKASDKIKLFSIASKIDSGVTEYSVEEIALVKNSIGDHPSILVVGKCFELIEKGGVTNGTV